MMVGCWMLGAGCWDRLCTTRGEIVYDGKGKGSINPGVGERKRAEYYEMFRKKV